MANRYGNNMAVSLWPHKGGDSPYKLHNDKHIQPPFKSQYLHANILHRKYMHKFGLVEK